MRARKLLVSVSVADVRGQSSHGSELLTQAILGVEVDVLRATRDRAWYLVRLPDSYVGWVRSWSVVPVRGSELLDWRRRTSFQVSGRSVQLREKPSRGSAILCELVLGTRLPKLVSRGDWVKTALPDSTQGWVELSGLRLQSQPGPSPTAPFIIRTAFRFMGAPYLWGGTTPWGCDCSGLVQSVYSFNGIELPRDARDQLRALEDCSLEIQTRRFQPGDLLFFGRGLRDISHVAISTGGFSFVHSHGCVRRGSLRRGEPGYSLEISRLLRAAAGPLGEIKKTIDKKKGLQ
jgi:gamma-D-glutamyl-L-lysine dipeptidyl-peptidase